MMAVDARSGAVGQAQAFEALTTPEDEIRMQSSRKRR